MADKTAAPAAAHAPAAPTSASAASTHAAPVSGRAATDPAAFHAAIATMPPPQRAAAIQWAQQHHGNAWVQQAMTGAAASAHAASAHGGHEVGRVHVDINAVNPHDGMLEKDQHGHLTEDRWRLGLHGGHAAAGADAHAEAFGEFAIAHPELLAGGRYMVDSQGSPLVDVPLAAGSHVRLNAGTLVEIDIDGHKQLCTTVFCAEFASLKPGLSAAEQQHPDRHKDYNRHYETGYVPVAVFADAHRIQGAQGQLQARMQGAIGREHQHGAALRVRAVGYPTHWEDHVPHPWHAPLRTFPNQRTTNHENPASTYFGAGGRDGHCGLYASPPYPDFGVELAVLGEGDKFFPTGEDHHCTLWYSKRPDQHGEPPAAPHKLPFVKGYVVDASGRKTYGWVNRLQLISHG